MRQMPLLVLALALSGASAADNHIVANWVWTGDESYASTDNKIITPSSLYTSTNATFTANPPVGKKVDSWQRYNGSAVSSNFIKIQDGGATFAWTYDKTVTEQVWIGVKLDWIRYTLSYDGKNSSTWPYTNDVEIAGCDDKLTGYTFGGSWTNSSGKSFAVGSVVTGKDFGITNRSDDAVVRLFPKWKANRYTVRYDVGKGSLGPKHPTSAAYDEEFAVSDPVRDGYGFKAWTISPEPEKSASVRSAKGETLFKNLVTENNATVTLTADWTNCTYSVDFNNMGGSGHLTSLAVTYDMEYKAVDPPTKDGYEFLGYATDREGGELLWDAMGQPTAGTWSKTDVKTVYAQWKAEEFWLAFDGNGASGSAGAIYVTNGVETVLSDGHGLSYAGCTLLGWSESEVATSAQYKPGEKRTFFKKVEKLFAVWEKRYYVAFDGQNATSGKMTAQSCVYGKDEVLKANLYRKTGYTFGGWADTEEDAKNLKKKYDDGQIVRDLSDVPGKTNVLYAVWQTNSYVVAFDPGRGSGEMAPVPFVYDEAQALPGCSFNPPSDVYSFGYWENPLTGEHIANEAVVSNLCAEVDGTNVLKAIWTQDVGDLSRALHCDTLIWKTNDVGKSLWQADEGDMGLRQYTSSGTKQELYAEINTNGVLNFFFEISPWENTGELSEKANLELRLMANDGVTVITKSFLYQTQSGGQWVTLQFADVAVSSRIVLRAMDAVDDPTVCKVRVDNVVWTPEGAPVHPEEGDMTTNAVPTAVEGLIYTGSEQVGVPAGTGYWIKGNVAVDPGDYVATATPLSGYCWEGGSTAPTNVSWKISKYRKDVSGIRFEDKVFTYDGEAHAIAAEGELPDGVVLKYEGETSRTAAGTNEVKVCFSFTDPSEAELYELWPTNELNAKLIVKRARKNVDHVTFDDVIAVYDGQPHSIAVTNDLPEGVEVVYTPNDATNRVDAGTNEVTVTFKLTDPDNYEPIDKELKARLIVLKGVKDVSGVTFPDVTVEYDGKEHALSVAGDVPDGVSVVYSGETKGTEIGTYVATAKFEVTDAKNWEPIDKTLSATLRIVAPPDPTQAYKGIYFRATLEELGVSAVPTDRKVTVKAEGLPKGLKLVTTAVKEGNKVVRYEYRVEGVPTETMDGETRRAYVRVTDGKVQTLYWLDLSVRPAEDYEQCSFPDGTNGVTYANYSVTKLWPDVSSNAANWTISGLPSGLKYTKKAVTAKKKIDGVNVTVTNAMPYEVYGTPTKAGRFTVTAVEKIVGTSYKTTHVATLVVWPSAPEPEAEWTNQAYVEIADRKSADDVTAASGLPSGVKFAAKDVMSKGEVVTKAHQFYGTPTKAGTSVVTLTHADKSKSQFLWTITPAEAPEFELKLTETSVSPETAKATVLQGVAYEWAITNTPGAKVAASGLPTGLKLASTAVKVSGKTVGTLYAVRGVPTKEGEYFATFKTTLNGITTVSTAAFVVKPLPAWAQGTFDGGESGQVSFAVTSAGKISGKYLVDGKTWSVSAASYDSFDDATQAYLATIVGKCGSGKSAETFTNELAVTQDMLGGLATNAFFVAYQNTWKSEPWKSIGKKIAKAAELTVIPTGFGEGDALTLKFAASGSVKVAGKFVKSVSEQGKVSYLSVSGSAVLCPQTKPDSSDSFRGVVFVYFPPKAGTPLADGLSETLYVEWDGAAGVFRQVAPEK